MLTLADALEALTNLRPIATTVITEAVIDSRQVIPGSLFVAIPGEKVDGQPFAAFMTYIRRSWLLKRAQFTSAIDEFLATPPG